MKFTKMILRNWIGVYLGLGLTELEIDFSRGKNRICLIVGMNGSSKTTILEALTLFTDIYSSVREANDFIIVDEDGNKNGYRELWVEHNGITFVSKVHWLTDKTKCFLYKMNPDGSTEDLNPNGNVRSYEDQLEIYFGLTKAHNKLLFLGPGLKDVISMIPSERKSYISVFTPNIDGYLGLYKETAKYYSKLKNDIAVLTAELKKLGDDRNRLETIRNSTKEKYDVTVEKVQFLRTVESNTAKTISMLSVNGVPIVELYQKNVSSHNALCSQLNVTNIQFKNLCIKYGVSASDDMQSIVTARRDSYLQTKFQRDSFVTRYRELQETLQNLNVTRNSRKSIYQDYMKNNNPDKFLSEEKSLNDELTEIQSTITSICEEIPELEDINSILFTKEDATRYLIFIDSLSSRINDIQDQFTEKNILSRYLDDTLGTQEEENEYLSLKLKSTQYEESIQKKRDILTGFEQSKDLSELLNSIPSNCKNVDCPFIQKAKHFYAAQSNEAKIRDELAKLIENKSTVDLRLEYLDEYVQKVVSFYKVIREFTNFINSYSELISKFPNFDVVLDPRQLFRNTAFLLPRARRFSEYSYIHERYMQIVDRLYEIKDLIHKSSSYFETLKTMEQDIENSEKQVTKLTAEIQQLYSDNQNISSVVSRLESELSELNTIMQNRVFIVEGLKQFDRSRRTLKAMRKRYFFGKHFTDRLTELRGKIQFTQSEVSQYGAELNTAEYNLRRYDEFIIQRDSLSREFELLDVLRKCWSPTTGIPLIFIEGFMNELLAEANKYLQELWSSQDFLIKGFNIDEKNFYILVDRGNSGFVCKDASQCSGAERSMLCTVLSLALLRQLPQCEDMFNITKFDEIDGALDYEKKRSFLGILNDLLDEIHAEQSFIISHSDTFQSDVDVILLKGSEEYKQRFLTGDYNIIYQY